MTCDYSLNVLLLGFVSGGAIFICQGRCEDIPNCDAFCKSQGFPNGTCTSPANVFCCCQTNNVTNHD